MLHVCGDLVHLAGGVGFTGFRVDGLNIAHALYGGGFRGERAALRVAHEGHGFAGFGVSVGHLQRLDRQTRYTNER